MSQISFDQVVERFGEVIAQSLLENIERYKGISGDVVSPLEDRWQAVMQAA